MEWTQFAIIFIGVFGLFIWNRTESRADIRHMELKMEANRELLREIHLEMKDFHLHMMNQTKDFYAALQKQDADFKAHLLLHEKEKRT